MYRDGFYVHHSGPGFFGWFFMIMLVLLLVALVALAVRYFAQQPRPQQVTARHDDPLDVLRMRYARGEIDRESFLSAHADLGGVPPPAL